MSQYAVPSAPTVDQAAIPTAPPSYDEAVGNVASPPRDQNITNTAQLDVVTEEERKNASPPLVTVQPQPQQQMTTHIFDQPVHQQSASPSNDWDGSEIPYLCYYIFFCLRDITSYDQNQRVTLCHDAGGCDCGDTCCDCPEGCCDCGDCDCDCGDCDCGDCDCGDCDCGDCDCGDCDCGGGGDCDCGDCSII